jgi:hypothetical protein
MNIGAAATTWRVTFLPGATKTSASRSSVITLPWHIAIHTWVLAWIPVASRGGIQSATAIAINHCRSIRPAKSRSVRSKFSR